MIRLARSAAWVAAFVIPGSWALLPTRASGAKDMQSGINSGGTVTNPLQIAVTGCLKREGEDGGYFIVDRNGTTWILSPNGMKLAEHVNQNVMITGRPDANTKQHENNNQGGRTEPSGKPQVRLQVLTVKMLDPKCGR